MIKNSIVLVACTFDDFSTTKVRPCLCLTSTIGKLEHIIIAFISSNITNEKAKSDFLIKKNTVNWIGTGLTNDSVIRLHKMVTIPKKLIKRKLGVINNDIEKTITIKISELFNIK